MTFSGFDRGARGVGVRDLVIAYPSVGCTNRTVELLGRARDDIRVLNHQHGCGMLNDDVALTADILAGVSANPNVRGAIIIGLGCESNVPRKLAERCAAAGADVRVTVFQEAGGAERTVAEASAFADELKALEPKRRDADPSDLKVGIVTDDHTGDALAGEVASALRVLGATPLEAGEIDSFLTEQQDTATRVYQTWKRRRLPVLSVRDLVKTRSEVEQLAAFAAAGAQLAVFITGRGNPIGSPVIPTLKIGVNPKLAGILEGVTDLDVDPADPTGSAERVVSALLSVTGGEPVAAEVAGQRDFGIPRVAPTM